MATHFRHGTSKEDRSKFVTMSVNGSILGTSTTVGDSATLIPATALENRRTVIVHNVGSQVIEVGSSSVTFGTGIPIGVGGEKGFDVTGIDISPQNIRYANDTNKTDANIRMNTNDTNKNGELLFYVHDMRKSFKTKYFDYVVNLFTSFGYFEKDEENYLTISAAAKSLKPNGHLIVDFMNSKKVMDNLVENETKNISGLQFDIHRSIESSPSPLASGETKGRGEPTLEEPSCFIVKQIKVSPLRGDGRGAGKNYFFQERVKALTLKDFKKYFDACGFKMINLFGDYTLSKFDEKRSDRLILICEKT